MPYIFGISNSSKMETIKMSKQREVCAVFPGSFDPVTNGHIDVIYRCAKLYDRLIVAVGENTEKKQYAFDCSERVAMLEKLVTEIGNVEVESFNGLLVNYVQKRGAQVIVRALRNLTDVQYEFQLALTNRAVSDIETVFIMTGEQYAFTSSSLIREIGVNYGDITTLVPAKVHAEIAKKLASLGS